MRLQIRAATSADYPALSTLFAFVDSLHASARPDLVRLSSTRSADYVQSLLSDPDGLFVVAEHSSGLVAFARACVRFVDEHAVLARRRFVVLEDLVVHPEHRRHGIGTELVRAVETWAQERRAAALELNVYEFNEEARRFYEALGYTPQSRKIGETPSRPLTPWPRRQELTSPARSPRSSPTCIGCPKDCRSSTRLRKAICTSPGVHSRRRRACVCRAS